MNKLFNLPLGQIVSKNYKAAGVFSHYGIDFCCHGASTLAQACVDKGLDPGKVAEEVEKAITDHQSSTLPRFSEWPLGFLTDYILTNHHVYTKRILPVIQELLEKVEKVHGQKHPELHEVIQLFRCVHQELNQHMWKEENVLFPYIQRLDGRAENEPLPSAPFSSVRSPVRAMMNEHEREGNNLFKLQALTNNYTPPADACSTYKSAYATLKEFHDDLIQHISLENNILFPGSVTLEERSGTPEYRPGSCPASACDGKS